MIYKVAVEKKNDADSLVTVIVPVYNVEKYLCRCVDSIVNQTYKNLEIIFLLMMVVQMVAARFVMNMPIRIAG